MLEFGPLLPPSGEVGRFSCRSALMNDSSFNSRFRWMTLIINDAKMKHAAS